MKIRKDRGLCKKPLGAVRGLYGDCAGVGEIAPLTLIWEAGARRRLRRGAAGPPSGASEPKPGKARATRTELGKTAATRTLRNENAKHARSRGIGGPPQAT